MMKYVDAGLRPGDIHRLLVDTGWPGTDGRVSKGLDAFAAVFAALHGVLPDADEPNDTPATARDLLPVGPGNALGPWTGGFTTRSRGNDPDFWRFRVDAYSDVTVSVDWYQRLSALYVTLSPAGNTVRDPGPDHLGDINQRACGDWQGSSHPGSTRCR